VLLGEGSGFWSEGVIIAAGDTAVASCDMSCSSSPLEVSEMSGVVRDVVMGSEAGGIDWQVIGTGWGSVLTVAVFLILISSDEHRSPAGQLLVTRTHTRRNP
jgi:hypothetical protein